MSLERTERTGLLGHEKWSGQDVLDRTSRIGKLGLDSRRARQCLENVSFVRMFSKMKRFTKAKIFVKSLAKIFRIPIFS